VRSDTNVEDLPGFTGAGLNLTVPNVIGFENLVQAIQRVWASPFTERAFAWRQAHMPQPEHVYPAVLLLKTFASEKSGVLVTTDVETGDRHWLSIATSEGVGGAVEGQAAEELRVRRADGEVRLFSQASAPLRAEPDPAGGMRRLPASGRDSVLLPGEIEQLRVLADDVERRFPMPVAADGLPAPADIEFGFRAGELALFQIRPFVESPRARRSLYLIEMDRAAVRGEDIPVDLRQPPVMTTRRSGLRPRTGGANAVRGQWARSYAIPQTGSHDAHTNHSLPAARHRAAAAWRRRWAYPIDAYEETGIARLEGFRLASEGKVAGNRLPPGALLNSEQIQLRLQDQPDFAIPAPDAELGRRIVGLLGDAAQHTSVSVLDLSDPDAPVYAEHNGLTRRNPGSVGKVMVAVALLQALADLHPDDIEARKRVLKDTQVTADGFIRSDHHVVPFWTPELNRMPRRPIREGDTANLWSYLDWAMSASSNAAASMVIKQLMLLRYFGTDYPVPPEAEAQLFSDTPAKARSELLINSLLTPLERSGLDTDNLRQGSFFTAEGKRRVAGTTSIGTTHELLRLLVRMEQGQLVDEWSSRELKRLLYMTQWRIRYASAPVLKDAAVYFKSGSFYQCQPEEGYECRKYQGNKTNLMNSVAIVESPAGEPRLFYMVALTSNVLKKNSAVEHQTFATRLHALLKARRSTPAAP
jgi:hypothetical protein